MTVDTYAENRVNTEIEDTAPKVAESALGRDAAKLQIALLCLRHYSLGPNPQAAIDALRQVEAIEREQPDIPTLCDKLPE